MSGGSMDYVCFKVKEYAVGMMGDAELNDLMKDVAELLQVERALSKLGFARDEHYKMMQIIRDKVSERKKGNGKAD